MPATIVVGLQWGDEGKGKATDLLAESVSHVVRYQGGDNAGHTIVIGDEVFKLHLVPSGVLYPHIVPIIANGVVVNPQTLLDELAMLEARGIATDRVRVSGAAHVIMPYHVTIDVGQEAGRPGGGIGTTHRGIGPAYADRAARIGIRMGDLLEPAVLRPAVERALDLHRDRLLGADPEDGLDVESLVRRALAWGAALEHRIVDTTTIIQAALAGGGHVLLEGAQGALLDLDHGTYPYVTSSNPIAGGACTGAGIGPLQIDEVIGVMKAYATRVGAGPFPSELDDPTGRHLLERGREFGTTTGRQRRCGWFDAVPLRAVVAVNSVSSIMLNKLDILSGLPVVRLCVGYRVDGRIVDDWPVGLAELERAEPVYETFAGWEEDLATVRRMEDLPPTARAFVDALEARAGVPITIVSIGAERNQTIIRGPRPGRHRPSIASAVA
jgi:adenylosuccinate synthase